MTREKLVSIKEELAKQGGTSPTCACVVCPIHTFSLKHGSVTNVSGHAQLVAA